MSCNVISPAAASSVLQRPSGVSMPALDSTAVVSAIVDCGLSVEIGLGTD